MSYEVYFIHPHRTTDNCSCDTVTQCYHNTWMNLCPECNHENFSEFIHGPYDCPNCGASYMGSVEYFTEGEPDASQEEGA
jgi:ribosomal protein L37AE/L43A